jgi:hypothetical protein
MFMMGNDGEIVKEFVKIVVKVPFFREKLHDRTDSLRKRV